MTVVQKPTVLKSTTASRLKAMLSKKEYTTTQIHINNIDPTTATQVITVQLWIEIRHHVRAVGKKSSAYYRVLRPTNRFAEKMAEIATVVPKSARESRVLPDHENCAPPEKDR